MRRTYATSIAAPITAEIRAAAGGAKTLLFRVAIVKLATYDSKEPEGAQASLTPGRSQDLSRLAEIRRIGRRQRGTTQDPVCDLLGHHHYGRIEVASDHARHDRRVDNPHPSDGADAPLAIHDGLGVGAHPAGAARVV